MNPLIDARVEDTSLPVINAVWEWLLRHMPDSLTLSKSVLLPSLVYLVERSTKIKSTL